VLDEDVYDHADKVIHKLNRLPIGKRFVTSKTTLRLQQFMDMLETTGDDEEEDPEISSLPVIR
jgi:hypothetical protein